MAEFLSVVDIPPGPAPDGTRLVARGLIAHGGRVLITRRPETDPTGANGWCLPGGKGDELNPVAILRRELWEELEAVPLTADLLCALRYTTERPPTWDIYYYVVEVEDLHFHPDPREVAEIAWVGPDELDRYDIVFGNREVLDRYFASIV